MSLPTRGGIFQLLAFWVWPLIHDRSAAPSCGWRCFRFLPRITWLRTCFLAAGSSLAEHVVTMRNGAFWGSAARVPVSRLGIANGADSGTRIPG
jgi:hypothetical protein